MSRETRAITTFEGANIRKTARERGSTNRATCQSKNRDKNLCKLHNDKRDSYVFVKNSRGHLCEMHNRENVKKNLKLIYTSKSQNLPPKFNFRYFTITNMPYSVFVRIRQYLLTLHKAAGLIFVHYDNVTQLDPL